jgi:hypothetical protein
MFKKLSLIVIGLLITTNVFATQGRMLGRMSGRDSGGIYGSGSIADSYPIGLTFLKDYTKCQNGDSSALIADFSLGSPIATFTRSPTDDVCTYIDSNGVIQLATANTPRFAGGYYDSTGFHSAKGLMVEGEVTNRATYSSIPENAAWTKTNITADNDDAGSSSPDGVATSPSLTATAANGTFTQAYVDAVAGVYTASLYIKRKTGAGTINLRANTGDAYTAITASVLTTTWTRVSVSSSSLTNPTFDLQITDNDAGDKDAVYIYGCQLEKNPYMTSLVPCATTAATRKAETLNYAISGNRTAAQETIAIQFMPLGGSFENDGVARTLIDTITKQRHITKVTTGAFLVRPNNSDFYGVLAFSSTTPTVNTSYIATGVVRTTPSPQATIYINGSSEGTSSTNTWDGSIGWGSTFSIGSSDSSAYSNCLIQGCHIYNRPLTAGEVLAEKSLFSI